MSTNASEFLEYLAARISRRYRISLSAARVVAELAGIGQAVRS